MRNIIRISLDGLNQHLSIVMSVAKFEQAYATWRRAREANPAQITEQATRNSLIERCLNDDVENRATTLQIVALIGESGMWHARDGHNDFRIEIDGKHAFTFTSSYVEETLEVA